MILPFAAPAGAPVAARLAGSLHGTLVCRNGEPILTPAAQRAAITGLAAETAAGVTE
jgi:hypothetical protein